MLKIKVKEIELEQDNVVGYIHSNYSKYTVNVIVILPQPQVEDTHCQETFLASSAGS